VPARPGPGLGLSEELKLAIEKYVSENKVVLFMKGNRQFPQCGFSNTCVQILNMLNVPYETVNILEDERLRSGMKVGALPGARCLSDTARTSGAWPICERGAPRAQEYSQWPTFPQVYIGGEFYGGCDIMIGAALVRPQLQTQAGLLGLSSNGGPVRRVVHVWRASRGP
jgi:monothiol glutaredoxin